MMSKGRLKNHFSEFCPTVKVCFFVTAIVLNFALSSPIFLAINFISAACYAIAYGNIKTLLYAVPLMVVFTLVNPLLNHQGVTVLFQVGPICFSLEALLYGIWTSFTLATVVLWFSNIQNTVSNRELVGLFGTIMPTIGMMVGMIFRFIPTLSRQAKELAGVQKTLGLQTKEGSFKKRIVTGAKLLAVLFAVSLENTLITAQSMKSRGHGLKTKTKYHTNKPQWQDVVFLCVFLALAGCLLWASRSVQASLVFYPTIAPLSWDVNTALVAVGLLMSINMPVLYNGWEELRWLCMKSKI